MGTAYGSFWTAIRRRRRSLLAPLTVKASNHRMLGARVRQEADACVYAKQLPGRAQRGDSEDKWRSA